MKSIIIERLKAYRVNDTLLQAKYIYLITALDKACYENDRIWIQMYELTAKDVLECLLKCYGTFINRSTLEQIEAKL